MEKASAVRTRRRVHPTRACRGTVTEFCAPQSFVQYSRLVRSGHSCVHRFFL